MHVEEITNLIVAKLIKNGIMTSYNSYYVELLNVEIKGILVPGVQCALHKLLNYKKKLIPYSRCVVCTAQSS